MFSVISKTHVNLKALTLHNVMSDYNVILFSAPNPSPCKFILMTLYRVEFYSWNLTLHHVRYFNSKLWYLWSFSSLGLNCLNWDQTRQVFIKYSLIIVMFLHTNQNLPPKLKFVVSVFQSWPWSKTTKSKTWSTTILGHQKTYA